MAGKRKSNAGRPTLMTPETVKKLEEAFLLGCTDIEACLAANISRQTLYNYQKDNPEFIERKETLKENPVWEARKAVLDAIRSKEPAGQKIAFDYLTKRKRDEFADRVENTGKDGGAMEVKHTMDIDALKQAISRGEE
jgi:hypothetical protein